MSFFVFVSWLLCIFTSISLLLAVGRYRYLLIKPSIIVIVFFHLRIQWAATTDASYVESYLPNPWVFILLAQVFPLVGLLVSTQIGKSGAKKIWQRLTCATPFLASQPTALFLLLGYIVIALVLYLSTVPFSATGLFAALTDPADYKQSREESLKLVKSGAIRYVFVFLSSAFAPLAAVVLIQQFSISLKRQRWIISMAYIAIIFGMLFAVSLPGARDPAATVILTMVFAIFCRLGFPIRPLHIIGAGVVVLAFPVTLTILRSGGTLSLANYWDTLSVGIFRRVFYTPMETCLNYTHYAQTVGYIGLRGIAKLALLLGLEPINAPNYIGLYYFPQAIKSFSMNTGYMFAYYTFFGLPSFPVCLVLLWLLDSVLFVYRYLSDNLLLACVSALAIASTAFNSSEYTTVFFTHGFGVILIVAVIIDQLSRKRIRRGFQTPVQRLPPHHIARLY